MARTIRRQPFSVSTSSNDYTQPQMFTHIEFKGINDNKNDIAIDAQTFSDAKNVYVDDDGVLVSRPPFKFYDGEKNIVEQWLFGNCMLRLYRRLVTEVSGSLVDVAHPADYSIDELSFYFEFRCTTHETISATIDGDEVYATYGLLMPVSSVGYEYIPKVTCAQIEDKIFIWFAGVSFIAFNTTGMTYDSERYLYFEDAVKYLYFPIHKLVINGIESDNETKNFLTQTYKKRHLYSTVSSVNFEKLVGRELEVGLSGPMTQNTSKHLYDITVQENQDKLLVYPYSPVGNDYHLDIVQTPRATVVLRYSVVFQSIEISYDGKYFKPVPSVEDIIGQPMLTKDGKWIVAFTTKGIAKCKLVEDTSEGTEPILTWTIDPYMAKASISGKSVSLTSIDTTFVPTGYFETIEQFAYVFKGPSVYDDVQFNIPYAYAEWPQGAEGVTWSFRALLAAQGDGKVPSLTDDDIKVHFRYVAPTAEHKNLGAVVTILTGNTFKTDTGNITRPALVAIHFTTTPTETKATIVNSLSYNTYPLSARAKYMDISTKAPTIDAEHIMYETLVALNFVRFYRGVPSYYDVLYKFKYDAITDTREKITLGVVSRHSQGFKIMPNSDNILTDTYLYTDGQYIMLPNNGQLSAVINDTERTLVNNDNLILSLTHDGNTMVYDKNVHKLSADALSLASGTILSGDLVSYAAFAKDPKDFLQPIRNVYGYAYYIEQLGVENGEWVVKTGEIKPGALVRLRAYDEDLILPVGHPGNNTDAPLTLYPQTHFGAPEGWQVGGAWPNGMLTYPPLYPQLDGTVRLWQPGDPLPVGPIELYGVVNIGRRIQPLAIDANGIWYNIDGTLWTSQLSTENALELDELINVQLDNGTKKVHVRFDVPDHHATTNEHYFSFTTEEGHNLLEVTQTKRDENKLFQDSATDFLLYLPRRNEQKFSTKITNLHPLSDTEMGIFTEDAVWYTTVVTLSDSELSYTKPVKSKIPFGCRDGDGIVTALDGQAIIFPTVRGIAALAPQDFVATTEKSLSYLSDTIQDKYRGFYSGIVQSAALIPNDFIDGYAPQISICTYRYWILFHKHMSREILALDTRNATWWLWTTPYPIRSIVAGSRLHVLMQIDFSPIKDGEIVYPKGPTSLMGVSFIWADEEIADVQYCDDTVPNALNGLSELIYENEFVGHRRKLFYASPRIDWHFTSQKLHFNQINNYKAIKGIVLNLKGDDAFNAKFSTKAYRDYYHPEKESTVAVKVNDICTFNKRLNILHVMNFQYTLENDKTLDTQSQLKLNSLGIKYEVKERIR